MTFRVDGVSASYPQWQRSCCCDGRSVGKLGPGRVCGVVGARIGADQGADWGSDTGWCQTRIVRWVT